MSGITFQRLVHADWSKHPRGRWYAAADRTAAGWLADGPFPVPAMPDFVATLIAGTSPTLAGFDFPIGLPAAYGKRTALPGFIEALDHFGTGDWTAFYEVAGHPDEVSVHRPFYPARPGHSRRQHLLDGHRAATIDALIRQCERGTAGRRAAGCLFWTLGGNQVGRAALAGWRDLVIPARRAGAALWPFDGPIDDLAACGGLTLAETYPADAYRFVGAPFGPRESKRRRADRAGKAKAIEAWAERAGVAFTPRLRTSVRDGFGEIDRGGDRFDAVLGLLGMIGVIDGPRPCEPPEDPVLRIWEGWILGR